MRGGGGGGRVTRANDNVRVVLVAYWTFGCESHRGLKERLPRRAGRQGVGRQRESEREMGGERETDRCRERETCRRIKASEP